MLETVDYTNQLFSVLQSWFDEEIDQHVLVYKEPGRQINEKLSTVAWLARKAKFYNISQVASLLVRIRAFMQEENVEFVTYAHDNRVALQIL